MENSLTNQYRYAVGIPTRDRQEILSTCLTAFANQTVKPEAIVLVNNNTGSVPIELSELDVNTVILDNPYPVKGMSQGNNIAFNWIVEHDFKLAVKWDDDLIPEPDCMSKLLRWIGKYNAAGGCYPKPDAEVWKDGPRSNTKPPDKQPKHIQFFRWFEVGTEAPLPMETLGLYSGYAYSVDRMKEIGGFRLDHSPVAYREDTELSTLMGKNIIDPSAIAVHYINLRGGTREFSQKVYSNMVYHDQRLFIKKLKENNINPHSLFTTKEVGI